MQPTFSENLFEEFCRERGIALHRVPATTTRTPDYELSIAGTKIVVEVKEIDRNQHEQESDRHLEAHGFGLVTGGTPGERVRLKIQACAPQLKARSLGTNPTVLVLFDRGRGHLHPYHIRVAMFGLEQIHVSVPPIGAGRPEVVGMSHGPRRKMSPASNTSISAVSVLAVPRPDATVWTVYRNPWAAVPLQPQLLAPYGVEHFDIEMAGPGGTSDWRPTPLEA
jgi:hypothetical protein